MTTEEKAKAYAEKELVRTIRRHAHPLDELAPYFDSKDVQQAYLAGATEALASQWKEVDADNPETLPKEKQTVLCILADGEFQVARFNCIDTFELDGKECNVAEWSVGNGFVSYILNDEITHWFPIPPLKGGDV